MTAQPCQIDPQELAFSELGRTILENVSAGTDHGGAGCVLVLGV